MSEANAQEPTMEEILASIRRIISEDETPAAGAEPAEPEPVAEEPPPPPPPAAEPAKVTALKPEPVKSEPPKAEPPPAPKADVLELTQRVEPKAELPPSGDIDFSDAPAPPAPPAAAAPKPASAPRAKSLVSDTAASAAAGHFGQLAQSVAAPPSGRSLEEIVSEMLRPMLKDWLDENLPKIVEASVAAEVERISRRGY